MTNSWFLRSRSLLAPMLYRWASFPAADWSPGLNVRRESTWANISWLSPSSRSSGACRAIMNPILRLRATESVSMNSAGMSSPYSPTSSATTTHGLSRFPSIRAFLRRVVTSVSTSARLSAETFRAATTSSCPSAMTVS